MTTIHTLLGERIETHCPIHGIAATDPDPHKWRIDFKDEATPAQRQAATDWLATCDLDAIQAEVDAEAEQEEREREIIPIERKVLVALVAQFAKMQEAAGQPIVAKLQPYIDKYNS